MTRTLDRLRLLCLPTTWVRVLRFLALRPRLTRVAGIPTFAGWPRVSNRGTLVIGRGATIYSFIAPTVLEVHPGATLVIGEGVFLNNGVILRARHGITVGAHTAIGYHALVMDGEGEPSPGEPGSEPSSRSAGIAIGAHVWIAARATILGGVTVGDHAVVAAGAVVTEDVPPHALVAGVPARVIRLLGTASG